MEIGILMQATREITVWGFVIPGIVMLISIGSTYMLYRHFAKQMEESDGVDD